VCEAAAVTDPTAPIPITDVSHVSIGVSDMERSIAFYRDVFGWEQLFDERMEGPAFEELTHVSGAAGRACGGRIGSLRVELMQFNFIPDVPAPSGLGLRVLSLETPDAHAGDREHRRQRRVAATVVERVQAHAGVVDEHRGVVLLREGLGHRYAPPQAGPPRTYSHISIP
jgi:catechol 2,3-dioxygenase-like lactoylglutathione lyase family enzyme